MLLTYLIGKADFRAHFALLSRLGREGLPRSIRRLPFPDQAPEAEGQRAWGDDQGFGGPAYLPGWDAPI